MDCFRSVNADIIMHGEYIFYSNDVVKVIFEVKLSRKQYAGAKFLTGQQK